MSVITTSLVRMANQIAANSVAATNPAEATAIHLKSYWTPEMLSEIKKLHEKHPEYLSQVAALAVATI